MNKWLYQGFRLGDWLVIPQANLLVDANGKKQIEPKLMDVLVYLAAANNAVVGRSQILGDVWNGVVVNEEALTRTISELRSALHDNDKIRRYIQTVPKRGYSLIVKAEKLSSAIDPDEFDASLHDRPSIAVLPFKNLSPDQDSTFISDGLTEELIYALARIKGLHTAASRSVFAFKDKNASLQMIAQSLGVSHILEGSVRRSGNQLRVTCQLIRVIDEETILSSVFDKTLDDLFKIQKEISESVVATLEIKLNIKSLIEPEEQTTDLIAYELFLRGRLKYQSEQLGMSYNGSEELEAAIRLAPDFPEAQGLFAWVRTLNAISIPYTEVQFSIKQSYEAALSINPSQVEALMAKAIAIRWDNWDWVAVKSLFERALSAAPNSSHVITQFAIRYYRDICQFDIAETLLQKAIKLDPINAAPRASLSFVKRYQHDFDAALEEANLALRINPHHGYAKLGKFLVQISREDYSSAYSTIQKFQKEMHEDDMFLLNCQARFYAATADMHHSTQIKHKIVKLAQQTGGEKYGPLIGWQALILGNIDEGIKGLKTGLDNHISQALNARAFASVLPNSPLNDDRFQAFLSLMNLDDEAIKKLHKLE